MARGLTQLENLEGIPGLQEDDIVRPVPQSVQAADEEASKQIPLKKNTIKKTRRKHWR